jgi:hypothetical protein
MLQIRRNFSPFAADLSVALQPGNDLAKHAHADFRGISNALPG